MTSIQGNPSIFTKYLQFTKTPPETENTNISASEPARFPELDSIELSLQSADLLATQTEQPLSTNNDDPLTGDDPLLPIDP